jgi:hypothetical protein
MRETLDNPAAPQAEDQPFDDRTDAQKRCDAVPLSDCARYPGCDGCPAFKKPGRGVRA